MIVKLSDQYPYEISVHEIKNKRHKIKIHNELIA